MRRSKTLAAGLSVGVLGIAVFQIVTMFAPRARPENRKDFSEMYNRSGVDFPNVDAFLFVPASIAEIIAIVALGISFAAAMTRPESRRLRTSTIALALAVVAIAAMNIVRPGGASIVFEPQWGAVFAAGLAVLNAVLIVAAFRRTRCVSVEESPAPRAG